MQVAGIVLAGAFGLLVGGSGIGAGGLLAYGIVHARRPMIPVFVSAGTGTIAAFIWLEIFPESIRTGGLFMTLIGVLAGYALARKMDRLSHRVFIMTNNPGQERLLQSGMLLAFAVGLHNFPTGMALGSSLMGTPQIARHLSFAMVIHSVPEGLALGLPLALSKVRPSAILITAVMVAVPTGLGAGLGYVFGIVFPSILSFMLGVAIGTIIYVTFFEILSPAWKESGARKGAIGFLCGWALGLILISIL